MINDLRCMEVLILFFATQIATLIECFRWTFTFNVFLVWVQFWVHKVVKIASSDDDVISHLFPTLYYLSKIDMHNHFDDLIFWSYRILFLNWIKSLLLRSNNSTYWMSFENINYTTAINMWIPILVIIALLILLIYKATKKPKSFPPGPPRLPIIGSLPYIMSRSDPSEPPSLMTGIIQGLILLLNDVQVA